MLRQTIRLLLAVICLLCTSVSYAQLPQISSGLGYLTSTQNADGTWQNSTTQVETTAATVSVLETLKLLNQTAGTPYTTGAAWLQAQTPQSVDYIAERLHILGLSDVSSLIPSADATKGGWGGDAGYETNLLDTASALQALNSANYPDLAARNTALAYLTNTQNPDGGWAFTPGGDSSIYVTAIVSATLQQFPQSTTIANTITKASAYLTGWQNQDGGFGTSPSGTSSSTVFETALSYAALVGDGQTPAAPLQNAVNYLSATQAANGSWNDDPYATALALKALYFSENKPAPPPPAATTGSIMGTVIDAVTKTPVSGVNVTLVGDSSFTVISATNGQFSLSGIPVGSQQITLVANGYASVTVTAAISAGTFINLGNIGLSATPTTGTVMGIIWDADENAPYPGVTVEAVVNNNISLAYQTISGPDGSFKITGVAPGTVTVGTPSGPKAGYWNVPMTGTLAPGGIMLYNPHMSKTHPPFADLYLKTDKALYRKGDTVNLTVDIRNNRSIGYPATLKLHVADAAGTGVYDTSMPLTLQATTMTTQSASFVLPADAKGGFYAARAELYDVNDEILATSTANFGLLMSQISVTPKLPASFAQGANSVTFELTNKGNVAVSAGNLAISLTDPDGQELVTASQPFTLVQGESITLTYPVNLPTLRFGTYTLSYTQSDETTSGQATNVPLPNTLTVSSIFDKTSYRIRELANLLISFANSGHFDVAGVAVCVEIPDAGFKETRTIPVGPAGVQIPPALYSISLPETMVAGQHAANISLTLPSGSIQTLAAQLTIAESALSLSPVTGTASAGSVIAPVITNKGGVDTQVQYILRLYDAKSALIAEQTGSETVIAGSTLTTLALTVPTGAVDGSYNVVVQFKDLKTGKEESVPNPVTIAGVKGTLMVQTDKQTYLLPENISTLGNIANNGSTLQGGNYHLQVVAAGGNQVTKTWTSQYDFQQGVRNGTDTFSLPDNVTLVSYSDTFDSGLLNTDRWSGYASSAGGDFPTIVNGRLKIVMPYGGWNASYVDTKVPVTGDFDVQVDYQVDSTNYSNGNNHPAGLAVWQNNGYYLWVDLWGGMTYGTYDYPYAYSNAGGGQYTGKFRISRIGSSYTSYYWNGAGWSNFLNTNNRPVGPTYIRLIVNGPDGNVTTYFDNFKVITHTYPITGTLNLKYDSGRSATWDKLSYTADTPPGTSIKFRTRTADTEGGLSTATWSSDITDSGSSIASPSGRWIEVEATLSTTNTATTPTLRDLTVSQGHNAGDVLWQADVPISMAQGTTSELNNTIESLGVTGKFYVQGTLTSSTEQTVATAEYPFYVEQGNIFLTFASDRKIYKPGETVTITGEVKNRSNVDTSGLMVKFNGTRPTGQTLYTETFNLPINGTHPFRFTTIAGVAGSYGLNGTVLQNGTVLAEIGDQYQVASPTVAATLTGPDMAGDAPFTLSLSITNSSMTDSSLVIGNSFGAASEPIVVPAGETTLRQYQQQISADTVFTITLTGDLEQSLTKSVTYIAPTSGNNSLNITSKVVVDKVSYNPNERVTITSVLTNQSVGVTASNLSALITVVNAQGQVLYSNSSPIQTLNQNQTMTFSSYWNAGVNPAGSYLVTLQVIDATGTIIATANRELVIASSVNPITLLKGQIALDKQSLLTGEPVTASYSITNAGNTDLADIAISLQTINLADQTVYNTITDQAALAMGASHVNSGKIDTQGYSAKDYLVVLRASIAGVEETLAGTYFRVEGAPSAPALVGPVAGSDVETLTPTLTVSNAADPNDDKLTYEFELYGDSGLTAIVTTGVVPETAGVTAWIVPAALVENQTYNWRARAFDGKLYGPWMAPASFRVNTVNDPPSAPTIASPADATFVATLTPLLSVNNASDPDSTNLTYNFDLALDPDFTQIVATTKGIAAGGGTTSWSVPVNLQENSWYYWRAQADDWLVTGPWSATARFFVNTSNEAPSAPAITSPADGSTVAALAIDVVVTNSTDPDSSTLTYFYEVDTVPTFDSPAIFRSGGVAEGEGTTGWQTGRLQDNTRYYVRAKSSDGSTDSPWSPVTTFFANTANDPPTVPILANPSNGAGVNIFSPTLSVYDATDPDHDALTYEFELYADAGLTNLVVKSDSITEVPTLTGWAIPVTLTENQTYYWRARAFDGALYSGWMPVASFMVNTANDAPGAPGIVAPVDGSTVATLTPTLTVSNAIDPDGDSLAYDFELYAGTTVVASASNVPGGTSGGITWAPGSLSDNTVYQWRARAFDGDRYGAWTAMAAFTVHIPTTSITVDMDFEPHTLNKTDHGNWVRVEIELPHGYKASDVDLSSIRLEGAIPAERSPVEIRTKGHDDGCDSEHDKHDHTELVVKFDRSEVINVLPCGNHVPVHVTGKVGTITFEGTDIIRVINQGK